MVRMEKLAENDLTYFYLRHVVIVVTAVTTISLPPVNLLKLEFTFLIKKISVYIVEYWLICCIKDTCIDECLLKRKTV
jgi:hypothetical protein